MRNECGQVCERTHTNTQCWDAHALDGENFSNFSTNTCFKATIIHNICHKANFTSLNRLSSNKWTKDWEMGLLCVYARKNIAKLDRRKSVPIHFVLCLSASFISLCCECLLSSHLCMRTSVQQSNTQSRHCPNTTYKFQLKF